MLAKPAQLAAVLLVLLRCGATSAQTSGLTPLSDLGPGTYQGNEGGLYPGGVNIPPRPHLDAALRLAAHVVPRDAAGLPSASGAIAMIAVGMSNTTHEFGAFERNEDASTDRNARVVIVDTAFGGQTAATIADPSAPYWTTMAQRLTVMGLTPAQVQVAWLKEADANPPNNFPVHAQVLRDELRTIVQNLHDRFPNLKLCYLSSRIYGGYAAQGSLNPEPQAYESGFSVKWLIADQIAGDPALNHDPAAGPVRAPLLLWGPYLWANGPTPRSDGLVWLPSDLEGDMIHPGPGGEQKVATMLSAFLRSDSTARDWWRRKADSALFAVDAVADAHTSSAAPGTNFGGAPTLLAQGGAQPMNIYLGFDLGSAPRPVESAKLSLRVAGGGIGRIFASDALTWSEAAITWSNQPAAGSQVWNLPGSSRDGTLGANVTTQVNADPDGRMTLALTTTTAGQASYVSREGGQAPKLVLTVSCANGGPAGQPDGDGDGVVDVCDCALADPGAWAAPSEVEGLRWIDRTTLVWSSAASAYGPGTRYDVLSGDLADVGNLHASGGDVCIGDDVNATMATDVLPDPATGGGRFYLVRGGNTCGRGPYEIASDGRDRLATACP